MGIRSGALVAVMIVSACGGGPDEVAPSRGLPAWDGGHIVCNEDVSFAAGSTTILPTFTDEERLGFCARSMRYIELHRLYGHKTSYFGVAATTTASLAATHAPLVRRAYSETTWGFMASLSRAIEEEVNNAAAKQGRSNGIFSRMIGGGPDADELIRGEQLAVQVQLDAFAVEDPEGYATLIEEVNGTFNPTNRLLIAAINRNPFFKAYEAGLAQVRVRHGGAIDFAKLEQRIEIGDVLMALIEGIAPSNPTESR